MKAKVSTAERIKEYMELYNLRQVDIVTRCRTYCRVHDVKLDKAQLNQYLSGVRNPGKIKLKMFSEVLNVNEAWLAGYDVPMARSENQDDELSARILAEASSDSELIIRIQKIQQLNSNDKSKVYGYIDAVYELSISSEEE